MRARSAVSRPSASQPAQYSMRIGWRFGWMQQATPHARACTSPGDCSEPGRERGLRLVRHVLLAAERAAVRHELDGDAPGVDRRAPTRSGRGRPTRPGHPTTRAGRRCRRAARPGRRAVDSGSRNACSMRWVWNTSCTTCALAAERGIDVAARVRRPREHVAVEAPHRVVAPGCDRGDRDRRSAEAADTRRRRAVRRPARSRGPRPRRSRARRRDRTCARPRG